MKSKGKDYQICSKNTKISWKFSYRWQIKLTPWRIPETCSDDTIFPIHEIHLTWKYFLEKTAKIYLKYECIFLWEFWKLDSTSAFDKIESKEKKILKLCYFTHGLTCKTCFVNYSRILGYVLWLTCVTRYIQHVTTQLIGTQKTLTIYKFWTYWSNTVAASGDRKTCKKNKSNFDSHWKTKSIKWQ